MKRVIFLVDMNAFFISCETTRRPELAGVPAAVAGDPAYRSGIILAANYEARRFGVRTTMVLHEARRLCPGLVLLPPDHDFYVAKSEEVMALFGRYTPLVEPNSIDEAWLDMTGCEGLSGPPGVAAESIMAGIRDELGLWCSIGIAENKYLAKMASDMKKPMGITELWPEDVPSKMWPLPVGELLGVGKKSAERLNRYGMRTIGDIARTDPAVLIRLLGKGGYDVWRHANGQDEEPVRIHGEDEMKSIGRSTTLPQDLVSLEEARPILIQLGEAIAATARQHGKKGRVVQITIRHADFTTVTRQTAIPATHDTDRILEAGLTLLARNWDPLHPVRLLGISLSGFVEETGQISLFDLPGGNPDAARKPAVPKPARGRRPADPRTLDGTDGASDAPVLTPTVPDAVDGGEDTADGRIAPAIAPATAPGKDGHLHAVSRSESLDAAIDDLRNRFGERAVQRASLVGRDKPRRHGGPPHKGD